MRRLASTVASALFLAFTGGLTGVRAVLDWTGRVAAIQDLQDKDGYAAKALNWFFNTPWWVPSACLIVALFIFVYLINSITNSKIEVAPIPDKAPEKQSEKKISSTITASVFDQFRDEGCRYVYSTSKTLKDVEVYLEYSTYYGMAGGGWTKPNRLHLSHFDKVPKGETKNVYLIGLHSTTDGLGRTRSFAKFGQLDENRHLIAKDQVYRCRMTLLDSEDQESHTYFILFMQNENLGPIVFGQHLFSHSLDWERVAATDTEALFT